MSRRSILYLCLAVLAVAVLIGVVLLGYNADWTGFQAYTEPQEGYHPPKTLWDWMGLLIIPLVLGVGVFLLNRSEQRRQAEIAEQQREEDRQQAYLDQMTTLLLREGLRKSLEEDEVRQVARTRTLTVLRGLDSGRKGVLLCFLYDSSLIYKDSPVISLCDAYLSEADLPEAILSRAGLRETTLNGANLRGADLSGADLSGADLREADLRGADLRGADLSRADLSRATLRETSLSGANLRGADLSGADLSRAILRGADLSGANLSKAKLRLADMSGVVLSETNLSKANLRLIELSGAVLYSANLSKVDLSKAILSGAVYDDTTKWRNGFDPVAAGAVKIKVVEGQLVPDETNTDESGQA